MSEKQLVGLFLVSLVIFMIIFMINFINKKKSNNLVKIRGEIIEGGTL